MAAVISHVPYIFPLFNTIVGTKSPLIRHIASCRMRVLQRLRTGAKRKDLFYYLVSSRTEFSVLLSHRIVTAVW